MRWLIIFMVIVFTLSACASSPPRTSAASWQIFRSRRASSS
jgi:hypothetical protein